MAVKSDMKFKTKTPCGTCPYRKDVPLSYWDRAEFEKLAATEKDYMGVVYGCHKKNGNVCVGWLIMQEKNGLPSIALRLALLKNGVTKEYLESLSCSSEMFDTTEEMIQTNFNDIL